MFNLLNFLVMCKNLLFTLRASGLVFVPSSVVPSFVVYCRLKGVFPSGGAIEPDGQYFYL